MRISVVIPAWNAWATLPAVLDALAPQLTDGIEAIVVDSTGDGRIRELAKQWPVRVMALPRRTLPGPARNAGAAFASGELLAFLDADAIPSAGWLAALEAGLGDADVAAGGVENGTPRSPIGTAEYLLEFSNWRPAGGRRTIEHAASCNLLVRRSAFQAAGGFAGDVWPGEDTVFTFPFGARGGLAFVPDARVRHLNRTRFRAFVRNQKLMGRGFVSICERIDFPHRGFSSRLAAPAGVAFRLAALFKSVARSPKLLAQAVALLPLLVAGLIAWSAGVASAPRSRIPERAR